MKKLIVLCLLLVFIQAFKFDLKPEFGGCCPNCCCERGR
jgi:hypothetical protein